MSSIVDMIFAKKRINPINLNKPLGQQMREPAEKKKSFEELLGRKKPRIEEAKVEQKKTALIQKPVQKQTSTINNISHETNKLAAKPLDKKEKQLVDKLKHYDSINDFFEMVDRNKEDVNKLFPKQKFEEKAKHYIPKTEYEKIALKRIEEVNKLQEKVELKKITNVIKTKGKTNEPQHVRTEYDIYCAKCRKYHDPDFHTKTKLVNVDKCFKSFKEISKPKENKTSQVKRTLISTAPIAKSKDIEKPKQVPYMPNVKKALPDTNKTTVTNDTHKINQIKQSICKAITKPSYTKNLPKPQGIFNANDFKQEEDDFIVNDDDNGGEYRRHMKGINRQFTRRYYSNSVSDYDDIGEANFDMIMHEEDYTARRGEEEDIEEERREEELKRRKKKNK
jgi:hypothetical protein